MDDKDREVKMVAADKIIPLGEENIRSMTAEQYNDLCLSIEQNGFVEPIKVCQYKDGEDATYRIIDGNHRYSVCRDVFGMKEMKVVVVGHDWDDDRFWAEAIRFNEIKGSFDGIALANKILEIKQRHEDWDTETLRRQLGMKSNDPLLEKLFGAMKKTLPPEIAKRLQERKKEIQSTEDLSRIVGQLMQRYGSTLNNNFMFFSFGGKEHVTIVCDSELFELVKVRLQMLADNKKDVQEFFKEVMTKGTLREENGYKNAEKEGGE